LREEERQLYFGERRPDGWVKESSKLDATKKTVAKTAAKWTQAVNLDLEFTDTEFSQDDREIGGYDVLVSLAPLPILGPQEVHFPSAELGRFACRAACGTPTVYLGKRAGYTEEYFERPGNSDVLGHKEYFKSKEFRHWVCHEFGHVVGLAHIHQDPRISSDVFKATSELIKEITAESRTHVTEKFVERGILERWPGIVTPDDEVLYSDWWGGVPTAGGMEAYLEFFQSSVMTHSIIARLLAGQGSKQPLHLPDEPTPADHALVRTMYGSLQQRGASASPPAPWRSKDRGLPTPEGAFTSSSPAGPNGVTDPSVARSRS
jgi:hypothetical protein